VAALMGGVALLHLGVNALTAEDESWQELRQRAVRSLREGAPLIIVYGTALPEWIGHYRAQAEEFAERYQSWGRPASVVSERDLTAPDRRQARILLGRPEANRWVATRRFVFRPTGFHSGDESTRSPSTSYVL
jgi:hypothetical protein